MPRHKGHKGHKGHKLLMKWGVLEQRRRTRQEVSRTCQDNYSSFYSSFSCSRGYWDGWSGARQQCVMSQTKFKIQSPRILSIYLSIYILSFNLAISIHSNIHIKYHKQKHAFKCSHCSKEIKDKSNLLRHIAKFHS